MITGSLFAGEAYLLDAKIVTEVLDWGETITGLRLEYSEEIRSNAITQNNEHPGKITYLVIGDNEIDYLYVNNSGKKGDIQVQGKYVFIEFYTGSRDWFDYRDYVTFNTTTKQRIASEAIYFYQLLPIETVSGNIIEPSGRQKTDGEIRVAIDEFTTFKYEGDLLDDGIDFYCHLYIPEGYETKDETLTNLPLVVHFPSGDVNYKDYTGKYLGAIFSHNDVTEWVTPEAQAEHPAFVLTYGASSRVFCEGDIYADIINTLIEKYNIDTSRIYGISLAGGTTDMRKMAIDYPDIFAGLISVSFDYAKMFYDAKSGAVRELVESKTGKTYTTKEDFGVDAAALLMDIVPVWCFMTEDDYSTNLTTTDDGKQIQSILDTGRKAIDRGYKIDIAYGENGELMWNGHLRGTAAEAQATEQIERAKAIGADNLITLFLANTVRQTGHWAWTAVYTNAAVRDWLFSQVNDTPYVPAK